MLEFIYKKKYKVVFVFCMDDINKTNSFNFQRGRLNRKIVNKLYY